MKKLAYVLSLVVMMLSVAPCCEQQSTQADECCQVCSPFYTCGACSGFMAMPLVSFGITSLPHFPTHFNSSYLQSFADGIKANIWQPPKLS